MQSLQMGTHSSPLFTSITTTPSPFSFNSTNSKNPKSPNPYPNPVRFSCIRYRPQAGPDYSTNADAYGSRRSKFNLDDEFFSDGEEEFGFRSSGKKRVWWSDEIDEIDDEDEEEFWIFKVLRAFGWMFPAIGISMLLGTGPNTLLMAIALPLGQTVLSLAIDKVWGRTNDSPRPRPRPRSRTKKKPFTKAASNTQTSGIRDEENAQYGKEKQSYPSWETSNDHPVEKGKKSAPRYGGWDELDKQRGTDKIPRRVPIQKKDGLPNQQGKGKLSRRARNRDTPLLLRLLIAVFPFLGSLNRLLF